ncbi:MAG: T9SS type A sorting domain-containing protein [Luteibaculaceae bacterium]
MQFRWNAILFLVVWYSPLLQAQNAAQQWDSIKATTVPYIPSNIALQYAEPYRQPLASYGWEDALQISKDGKHLYALYYPGDLLSWTLFFFENLNTGTVCELLGTGAFLRPYAETYGMDMLTNTLQCDTFINVDILYAYRADINSPFSAWELSGVARPGAVEGGPHPVFSDTNSDSLDFFLFTGNSDIWIINNTLANPTGIQTAVRLPHPINPITNEFNADNPHLERLNGDTLLLLYEKYTDSDFREFTYAFTYNNTLTWQQPITITTVNPSMGKIEHPHLTKQNGIWYLYYSLDCNIYRSVQQITNHWDSWGQPELVIEKGNSLCVGEATLTAWGDISFVVVYQNQVNGNPNDTFDIDPWYLPKLSSTLSINAEQKEFNTKVYPNPFTRYLNLTTDLNTIQFTLFDAIGKSIKTGTVNSSTKQIDTLDLAKGVYFLRVEHTHFTEIHKLIKQ